MPANDRQKPVASARSATSGPPVKQWNTPASGPRAWASAMSARVSASASRVWMTTGR